jgi:hypothetical protein
MISSSKSVGAVGSETAKHSKHPVALRLFYYTVIAIVGAALLPVIPAAAKSPAAPQVSSAPSAYTAVNPTRVMDTRTGSGIVGAGNTLGPAASFSLVVAPNATAGVPANATAVVMNVTATDTTAPSYLTVYPTLASLPFASNLNWVAGYTVPNLVTVQPGSGGAVTFYNKFGSVDVIADIAGYFAPPSGTAGGEVGTGFPQRLVDTRAGSGHLGAGSAIGPAATATYQVTGNAGVPASGVSAVIVNVTVTNTTAASFLTLWAAGATRNTVSNANWVAGWTRANRAIVPVSSTGQISVYNQFGSVDVILDVNGYFTNASASGKLFTSVSPLRLADHTALGPNSSFDLPIAGVAGVPVGASAAVLDAVVSETTAPSFLTASPSPGVSSTSDINWVAGQVNPNLTVTTLGTGGAVNFFNSAGNVNVSVDLEGYFGAAAGVTVAANPSSIPADGATTSTVTATVTNANGSAAINDPVNFTSSGSPAAACGAFTTANPTNTNGSGAATITYRASLTAGTCTITATEAQGGLSGSATITQTTVPNAITVTASVNPVPADGTTTSSIVSHVSNGGGNVGSDVVTYTLSGNPSAACGTLSAATATTATGTGLTPAVTYTASLTVGFCTLTATEAGTGSSASVVILQKGTAVGDATVVSANPTGPFPADGVKTSTITATVTGPGHAASLVSFTSSPSVAGACGTLNPTSATTPASGVVTTTYTVSTTAGTCTITATEANGGSSGNVAIVQTAVANNIALTATPNTLPADGATTSILKAVVTKGVGGAAVSGDIVTFTVTGAPCGTLSSPTATTDATGSASVTYTASTTTGFCTAGATDGSGGVGGPTTITQTSTAASAVAVAANPTSVPADHITTSTVTATVTSSGGGPVPNDSVNFTTSGSPAAACGTFTTANPINTNGAGKATVTYLSSSTVGTCTITATEASLGKTGSTTITQTTVVNTITVTASVNPVPADGATTSNIQSHVSNTVTGNVGSDVVTYTMSANPAGACGTLSASTATTAAGTGLTPIVTYTASLVVGFCTVTATEAGTGQSATVVITQKGTATNAVTVAVAPASVPADGTTTSTVTATVTGTGHGADLVAFTLTPSVAGACGTLSAASATTNAGGTAAVTYTASTTAGSCVVNVSEANGGTNNLAQGAGTKTITQTAVPNAISLAANPTSIKGDGITTSVITATVTKGIGGALSGDVVNFTAPGANCGTLSAASATTDAAGHASVTYTSKLAPSTFCVVNATETGTGSTTSVTVTQTA